MTMKTPVAEYCKGAPGAYTAFVHTDFFGAKCARRV